MCGQSLFVDLSWTPPPPQACDPDAQWRVQEHAPTILFRKARVAQLGEQQVQMSAGRGFDPRRGHFCMAGPAPDAWHLSRILGLLFLMLRVPCRSIIDDLRASYVRDVQNMK